MLKRLIKSLFYRKKPEALIPKIQLSEILPSEIHVDLLETEVKDGNVTFAELVILAQLVQLSKPKRIFEIGTFDGRTSLNFAHSAPPDSCIFTLDLGPKEIEQLKNVAHGDHKYIGKATTGERFLGTPEAKKIIQLWGDSQRFDFSPYYSSIDFILIDASHQYALVLKDSENALKISKPGATIIWQDYNTSWPGVTKALNELYQKDPHFKNLRQIPGTSLVILRI